MATLLACSLLVNPIYAVAAPHMAYRDHADAMTEATLPMLEPCAVLFDVLREHGIDETELRIHIGNENYRRLKTSIKHDPWTCLDAFSGEGAYQESDPNNWPLSPEEEP